MSHITRPGKDETWLAVAAIIAQRSTCFRRAVGCVLVNARGHVLSTGYNGRAAGLAHCNEVKREGRNYRPWGRPELNITVPTEMVDTFPHRCAAATSASGLNLDGCEAIHAEQNALLQCRDVQAIDTCYVTTSPCVTCVKLLMNTGCRRIVFLEAYAHEEAARKLWVDAGGSWQLLPT